MSCIQQMHALTACLLVAGLICWQRLVLSMRPPGMSGDDGGEFAKNKASVCLSLSSSVILEWWNFELLGVPKSRLGILNYISFIINPYILQF